MVVFAEPRRAVLGMGTLAPANAEPEARIAVQNEVGQEDLPIRIEKGRLQISENGTSFEELILKARHPRGLVEHSGPSARRG